MTAPLIRALDPVKPVTALAPVKKLELDGVNAVKKNLAGGGLRYYYYWRSTGLKLGTSDDHGAVLAEYNKITTTPQLPAVVAATPPNRVVGSITDAIERFYKSKEFAELSPRSQDDYRDHLEAFRAGSEPDNLLVNDTTLPVEHEDRYGDYDYNVRSFGELMCKWITPKWVKHYRDSEITTNDRMNKRITHVRRLFTFARSENITPFNPFEKAGKLETDGSRTQRWSPEEVKALLTASRTVSAGGNPKILAKFNLKAPTMTVEVPWNLRMTIATGIYTCQREGDILDLMLGNIFEDREGWWVDVVQNKTGKHVHVWVHPALMTEFQKHPLWATKDEHPEAHLCPAPSTMDGACDLEWEEGNFRKEMGKWKKHCGIVDRTFHDLRRTGMCHMREQGASIEDIASVSGHSIEETKRILEVYLPRSRTQGKRALQSILGGNDQYAIALDRPLMKLITDQSGDSPKI